MSILEYWKAHPEYLIAGRRTAEADAAIVERWAGYDPSADSFLDQIIFYDQFMRHFSRVSSTGVIEADVAAAREKAATLTRENLRLMKTLSEEELVFALMPLKHVSEFQTIFSFIADWLPIGKTLPDYPMLNRFYNDSYKKAFSKDGAVNPVRIREAEEDYDGPALCEACPPAHLWGQGDLPSTAAPLLAALERYCDSEPVVSLSGGVDSMVLCALARRAGLKVRAIHIVYGNRDVAFQECDLLADYCAAIDVPFHMYAIDWLRRDTADRAFYEKMTRDLRFAAYKAIDAKQVLLGHIREDVVENIWTNFAHGVHLEHLAKMSHVSTEDGVQVVRPWLTVQKSAIYEIAAALHIPHLKNTTPPWSNRGKFRSGFYEATHAQYGESVDSKVLAVAETLRQQALMLDALLYKPIYDSWIATENGGSVDISRVFAAGGLDGTGWSQILSTLCHTRLGICKPSIHACNALSDRLRPRSLSTSVKVPLKRGLTALVEKKGVTIHLHLTIENSSPC